MGQNGRVKLRRYVVTYGSAAVLVEDTSAAEARRRVEDEWHKRYPARTGRTVFRCRPATVRDEECFKRAKVAAWPAPRRESKATVAA